MTQTAQRQILLRYLPAGTKAGASGAYLTVGTYPMRHAFAITGRLAKQAGNARLLVGGGAIAVTAATGASRKSVYVAYPGVDYQIEVFDPKPGEAQKLVASGQLARVPVRK
jgi:hypothetical protein